MASYTNLASLEGLSKDDIITYTTTTAIDFKGLLVKVELYGMKQSSAYGGYTSFVIDTSKLPQSILSFNNDASTRGGKRNDLIYGNTNDLYYRIAVAGNGAKNGQYSSSKIKYGGPGGGLIGGTATSTDGAGQGGTQTSGGEGGPAGSYLGTTVGSKGGKGSFGAGGGSSGAGTGGYGWYGGGGGGTRSSGSYWHGGGGGGSGFIIGTSTTTYPTGYLGDDKELQNTIAASISEGVLTKGESSYSTPMMVITVLESNSGSSISTFKYYNGTSFIDVQAKYYNGTEFVPCNAHRYNGTEFVKLGG